MIVFFYRSAFILCLFCQLFFGLHMQLLCFCSVCHNESYTNLRYACTTICQWCKSGFFVFILSSVFSFRSQFFALPFTYNGIWKFCISIKCVGFFVSLFLSRMFRLQSLAFLKAISVHSHVRMDHMVAHNHINITHNIHSA